MRDLRRSLEEIEGDRWGEPPAGATRLVRVVHLLRRKPVGEMDVEDLRVIIGQQVSLAIERLRDDPLAEGDMYPGNLLAALLRVDPGFWGPRVLSWRRRTASRPTPLGSSSLRGGDRGTRRASAATSTVGP